MYYLILYLATWDKDRRTTGAPPLEWGQWNSISYLDSMHSDYFLAHPKVQKKGDDLVLIIGWYWLYGQFFMGIMILSKPPSGSIARHGNPRSIHGGLVRSHVSIYTIHGSYESGYEDACNSFPDSSRSLTEIEKALQRGSLLAQQHSEKTIRKMSFVILEW